MALPGTRVRFDFSVCKLLDLTADEAALRASREPAAIVILANWVAQQTGRDAERRRVLKWELTRRLYEMGLGKADIRELYRLVDWLVKLPEDLEARFHEQLYEYERKKSMPYVTSAERFGIAKGLQEGIEKGLQQGIEKGLQEGQVIAGRQAVLELLEVRFGSVPEEVREQVNAETNLERLRRWHRLAATCPALKDLRLARAPAGGC
jgi:flagellar biosynthesis/type III secretory pathway protein FliH